MMSDGDAFLRNRSTYRRRRTDVAAGMPQESTTELNAAICVEYEFTSQGDDDIRFHRVRCAGELPLQSQMAVDVYKVNQLTHLFDDSTEGELVGIDISI